MNQKTEPDFADLTYRYQDLIQSQQTLLLATASENSIPDISTAPFIRDHSGCFVIYVSDLASHTANLRHNPQVSLLFIRPEAASPNLFARERAIINCHVQEITRNEEQYTVHLQALHAQFGEVITLLSSLNDFHLFALCPRSGRYVLSFGKAFGVDTANDTVVPL